MIVAQAEILTHMGLSSSATDAQRALVNLLHPLVEGAIQDHLGFPVEQSSRTEFYPLSGQVADADVDLRLTDLELQGDRLVQYTHGQRVLQLASRYVRSVASVYEDRGAFAGQGAGDFAAGTLLTAGVDYFLDVKASGISTTGFLVRINQSWPRRLGTVKVTYTSGFSDDELCGKPGEAINASAIKLAVIEQMQISYNDAQAMQAAQSGAAGPVQSESINTTGYSVTYGSGGGGSSGGAQASTFGIALAGSVRAKLAKFMHYGKFF